MLLHIKKQYIIHFFACFKNHRKPLLCPFGRFEKETRIEKERKK